MAIDFVAMYVRLVRNGLELDKVPSKYREAVRKALEEVQE